MTLQEDLAYLKRIRICILLSVWLFFLAAVLGYFAAALDPEIAEGWMKELQMLKWILDQPPIIIMIIIFLKNLLACALAVLLGIGLGLVPLLVVTSNGFMLGVVSYDAVQKAGLPYLLAGTLPHGIIELPTVLIGIGVGFRLGHLLALTILGEQADLAGETRIALHLFLRRFAPLLLLAAAIETFITPIILSVVA